MTLGSYISIILDISFSFHSLYNIILNFVSFAFFVHPTHLPFLYSIVKEARLLTR
jgi:hypothetical protein